MKSREFVTSVEGFRSSDCLPPLMQSMFTLCGLPYDKTFACGSIELAQQERSTSPFAKRPGVQPARKRADDYGLHRFILNDTAVKRIRLVCAGDFQNIVCQLVTGILSGKTLEHVREVALKDKFRLIPEGTPLDELEEILRWAYTNKGSWPYAEARLLQPVRDRDGSWE